MGVVKLSPLGLMVSIITLTISGLLLLTKTESKTHWRDIQVLKDLKKGLDPSSVSPGSCISTWDFTSDPCDALFSDRFTCGFRCDTSDDSGFSRLTELALDQAGYSGSLTSLSFDLPYLETLDLSNNQFTGSVPDSVANLSRLRRLGLSGNSFTGEIPSSIGRMTTLEELFLDNNMLTGSIPPTNLTSLKRLELQNNQLSGALPQLWPLASLYFVDASNNNLSGEIPRDLPSSLVEISLRNNSLGGGIPMGISEMWFLQVVDLSHNRLSGSVPSFMFGHRSLQQVTLSFNNLEAVERPYLHDVARSELIALDLNDNHLQGLLPSFFGFMPKLAALSLHNNEFTGLIPITYAIKTAFPGSGVQPFQRLLLGRNYLFGPIPGPLFKLRPGSANVELTGNCFLRCPEVFFFCQGGDQKSPTECKAFGPTIP